MVLEISIWDFDGTVTKPDAAGSERYVKAHQAGLASMLDMSPEWLAEQYTLARSEVVEDPNKYGWEVGGYLVAPALVDICVEAQVCAQIILKALDHDVRAWAPKLEQLFHDNYLLANAPIRPEFLETIEAQRDQGAHCYIVTSSDTTKVQGRISQLGERAAWLVDRVHGHAKKHIVTPGDPGHMDTHMQFPGLDRPVLLHKGHYHRVLQSILDRHNADWSNLTMTGDVAELDLAVPVTLGARGILVNSPSTPNYERAWANGPRPVRLINDLREALSRN